ncbi:zinc ABC transporter substrate-binding protein ZnuA [Aestuariispira ectoiniformans]|uniref:zinc ABC transporter substrate-binding protein ZnuA n=1 Tax=Aestuariispira ectoiniformans TaxID=2775080 RepID=UPI00223AA06F|nr:zinc ABC transporter substrate-binding protein ZnuA [Aestuariispira ectoiniformans]
MTLFAGGAMAEPKVVASIQPIHSLVAGVMAGVGSPTLLVKGGGSPHSYSLRPSEARALADADVVFWVGEGLETFLRKPIKTLGSNARAVELLHAPGVLKIAYGPDEEHHDDDAHEHEHEHDEVHDEGHHHGAFDPHIWLDPRNAEVLVNTIAAELEAADPANKDAYEANANRLAERLRALDHALSERLTPVEKSPYVVFHEAYSYFEKRYHLNQVASVTVSPDRKPGAAHLKEIRQKIAESGAMCVFTEPQFEPKVVQTVVQGMDVGTGVMDPLGASLVPGEDAYFKLMESLAAGLTDCLTGKGN